MAGLLVASPGPILCLLFLLFLSRVGKHTCHGLTKTLFASTLSALCIETTVFLLRYRSLHEVLLQSCIQHVYSTKIKRNVEKITHNDLTKRNQSKLLDATVKTVQIHILFI